MANKKATTHKGSPAVKWSSTRYAGVRYWESKTRKHRGKADKCYVIRYKRHEQPISETVGWQSGGITPEYCSNLRGQIVSNIKTGEGYQGLAEKSEIERQRRQAQNAEKEIEARENTPFKVLAEKYIEWAKTEKKSWKDDESRYKHHIAPVLGEFRIKDIAVIHVENLKSTMKKKKNARTNKPLSDITIKHTLALLRQIFYKGKSWGMFDGENPVTVTARDSKTFRKFLKGVDRKRERFLSRQEAKLLLDELKNRSQRLHDYCQLALLTGMRMGEVFNLKWMDIDLNNDLIHIKDTKSGVSRHAYITPPLRDMFIRLEVDGEKGGLVFLDRNGTKIKGASNVFDRVTEKLGFNKNVIDARDKVVPHTLRHTFASWLAMQGESILTIQKLMGHSDPSMTLRYAKLSPSHEREAVTRLAQGEIETERVVELKRNNSRK
ncbi:MAG: site-specific integrase [Nitrospina sp.]|nr:site-specific integrase [Nitrospina sp.]MBT6296177.1 site-specific integrase [Nitrospina sp.]